MHELISAPFLNHYYVLRPGSATGLKVPAHRYLELQQTVLDTATPIPDWLIRPASKQWGIDLAGRTAADTLLVRAPGRYDLGRASVELNMFCNWRCPHCYLGEKEDAAKPWEQEQQILATLRDAGVVWLQITGGEPTVATNFPAYYSHAFELGMMIEVLTNGSRLSHPLILSLFKKLPPYRLVLSLYGATEATYTKVTNNPTAWKTFRTGVEAALAAGLPVELSIIVTRDNEHEIDAMYDLARSWGTRTREYNNMTPTYFGTGETLSAQALTRGHDPRSVFTGCDAGHTSLHVDPQGMASICKVARDHQVPLLEEGLDGLTRLGGIADRALLRQGGCTGCQLTGKCTTCMPLAQRYRQAAAPLGSYCQHTEKGKEVSAS
ncbi:radical SAM protein (plasmid) [Streptomyces sp. NBC_01220]|uniref:radical SAM protein n=1 Tax=Streptomyces sp. NBC_01220 TaxID=2903781 RepID=UPI00352C1E6F|nr:radical SAM protein [Streptomyces sp. NBC_01220]